MMSILFWVQNFAFSSQTLQYLSQPLYLDVHVLTKEMVKMAMIMLQYLPCKAVDKITVAISKLKYGKLSKYGIQRPKKGPFHLKETSGRSPVIDVGTISKIKSEEIKFYLV
ncbi:putative indole-3-pyruvate monooxygenase YUCCA10 [Gossypium australe]|uniref:Putative indole-3-pyruvate monooxygenase YUCCA10 n=1 Tax=Gossypium australe TaxID=47621 RepID=A0A5B6WFW2_9ROSI|nr:putative indole-3-pyruvate monooxygenase YUCCA10 [Gossypium australe]